MSNELVIKKFLERETGHTPLRDVLNGCYIYKGRTLTSTGEKLINYSTVIAYWQDDTLYINKNKYSQTTSKIQNVIRRLAKEKNINTEEYIPE